LGRRGRQRAGRGEGTDFNAAARTAVSVTPLQVDLTQFSQLSMLRNWLA